ncbi:hypothetical protein GUITHDRAFT_75261 [Guillardia theta CCMP2712]|uniref:non-specific serine/threonine protein kinase n=1 Tax=Guillardia theta (strain CCMP2712) TaxID=905079 RepID=L1IYC8_GUITC|nr:hypothetical protein GUITHDRAFT_75261 [Guillardia theta CCMP2712]EKX40815.1 hypothetical protein GUITHDRAFT_75261 [Guillardia theta CCMP2712]|eukprot:XP_005827795.1 hypothetical protein GUITHDRAFT_75261 [Guillardia theta CCMP2712]
MSVRDELLIYPVDQRFLNEVEKQFDLTRMVGSGTFGEVYEAYDRVNHRKVAIKRLFPYQTLDAHKKEAGFISSLNGKPNIVQLQYSPPLAPDGIILVEEQQALLFEFFEHDNPSDYVKDLTIKEISHYMKNLFVALRSVHSLGIIHRDVKLNNFLYDRKNKKYLLVDFGLAEKKIPKGTMGTRGYRAPEVVMGSQHQTTAVDVWSAGVILLNLLCRKTHFQWFRHDNDNLATMEIYG